MERIMVASEDVALHQQVATILKNENYEIGAASNLAEAVRGIDARQYDLVFSELHFPDGKVSELLGRIRETGGNSPVVVFASCAEFDGAVEALKLGAAASVRKPLSSPDELRLVAQRALADRRTQIDLQLLRKQSDQCFDDEMLILADRELQLMIEMARRGALDDTPLLIVGEAGSGKEAFARSLHRSSCRGSRPVVAVRCGELLPRLAAGELFGNENRSLTEGLGRRIGWLELVQGSTLFLDGIEYLEEGLQGQVLEALKRGSFARVGGARAVPLDARVIVASDGDPRGSSLRRDLVYRAGAFPLRLHPLRERVPDIPALANALLSRFGRAGGQVPRLSQPAMAELQSYSWPGNARELISVLKRAAIPGREVILPEHLSLGQSASRRPRRMAEIERQAIEVTLREVDGNRTQAAKILGISVRKLQYRLKEYASNGTPRQSGPDEADEVSIRTALERDEVAAGTSWA